jgi:hypothetical protein
MLEPSSILALLAYVERAAGALPGGGVENFLTKVTAIGTALGSDEVGMGTLRHDVYYTVGRYGFFFARLDHVFAKISRLLLDCSVVTDLCFSRCAVRDARRDALCCGAVWRRCMWGGIMEDGDRVTIVYCRALIKATAEGID